MLEVLINVCKWPDLRSLRNHIYRTFQEVRGSVLCFGAWVCSNIHGNRANTSDAETCRKPRAVTRSVSVLVLLLHAQAYFGDHALWGGPTPMSIFEQDLNRWLHREALEDHKHDTVTRWGQYNNKTTKNLIKGVLFFCFFSPHMLRKSIVLFRA